jgi:RNA polymerase-binding transcription factor DksA
MMTEDKEMDDTRKIFLKQLATKKKEFEDTLDRLMQSQKEYNEQYSEPADEFDHAQREILLFNNYSLVEKKAKELKSIDRLIRRVSRDQNFGICEECESDSRRAALDRAGSDALRGMSARTRKMGPPEELGFEILLRIQGPATEQMGGI